MKEVMTRILLPNKWVKNDAQNARAFYPNRQAEQEIPMEETGWDTYEQVAQYLLNQFAEIFQLGSVEGKQLVPGNS